MGREIKRVALEFNWPLGQVWDADGTRVALKGIESASL